VEAARFRLLLPWGAVGNLRMGEIVFHGDALGCSHPDVVAKRPVAVLFDEQDDLKNNMMYANNGLSFKFDSAFSGGRCLAARADSTAAPLFIAGFGHILPNWNFEIAEKPAPGQYRYLQFAWRALNPAAKGMTLGIGGDAGNWGFHAGEYSAPGGWPSTDKKLADAPPSDWEMARVDLWDLFKKPCRINMMWLGSKGGDAAFDQILLGRTEQDLQGVTPAKK
jgi:hypothetical protein